MDTGGIYWASSGMPRYSRTVGYAVRSPFLSLFFSGLFVVFLDVAVALRAVIAVYDGCLWRLWMVRGDVPILFLFWAFLFSLRAAVSRSFSRFSGFSAFLRIPGIVRESPPVPS